MRALRPERRVGIICPSSPRHLIVIHDHRIYFRAPTRWIRRGLIHTACTCFPVRFQSLMVVTDQNRRLRYKCTDRTMPLYLKYLKYLNHVRSERNFSVRAVSMPTFSLLLLNGNSLSKLIVTNVTQKNRTFSKHRSFRDSGWTATTPPAGSARSGDDIADGRRKWRDPSGLMRKRRGM
jgi:hypothetical protein